ncbi:MAG: glycoside hydrolase family 13 protein [Actinomycetota bacterium]|nr:glycoside hydrolase family 13 protein [Actinomycetota bacterium]
MNRRWWQDAVFYQVYVRSFADADGDGIGDLAGVTSRVPYLAGLGVDALWLTPFYPSPQADHGYDVADYRDVDPVYGDLDDFDALLSAAHASGLALIVDIVPNHTSSEHPWFQDALRSAAGSPERARYVFRPGRGRDGADPPNSWRSVFGGSAWRQVPDGEWYLHLFDVGQPDLNWENPEVGDEFEDILRFWLDRGVDGFRIDVAHALVKQQGLPDYRRGEPVPHWDQPEVHDVYRRWRKVLDSYAGDRMAVAEAWVDAPEAMALYVRPDELQQAFNFHWLEAPWSAAAFRRVIVETLAAVDPVDSPPTWVLSNHDVDRHVSRYGGGARGLSRARAATLTMLALPGSAYVYAGEELGLPQVDVPEEARQDPGWLRGGRAGRDGCRVPIPWSGIAPPYGFGPDAGAPTWLPQPPEWAGLSVAAQDRDPESTLTFYRKALRARRDVVSSLGQRIELLDTAPGVLAFRREPGVVCVINCGSRRARVGQYGEPVIASGSADQVASGWLPGDTAAWFRDA